MSPCGPFLALGEGRRLSPKLIRTLALSLFVTLPAALQAANPEKVESEESFFKETQKAKPLPSDQPIEAPIAPIAPTVESPKAPGTGVTELEPEDPLDMEEDEGPQTAPPSALESKRTSEEDKPQVSDKPMIMPDTHNYTTERRYIHHPFAKKGLMRITTERDHIYDVKRSEQKRGTSVRFGFFDPTFLRNPDTGVRFKDLYSLGNVPMIMVDYEWMLWRTFGKMYFTAGTGIFMASGNGRFQTQTDLTPMEKFTFAVVPLSVGVTWRAQFFDRQIIVPYATGGGTAFGFAEIRDDSKGPKFGGSPAIYGGGGVQFNLNFMDTRSMLNLDREYGINYVWLTVEYRRVQSVSQKFDLSSNLFNAGFLIEF